MKNEFTLISCLISRKLRPSSSRESSLLRRDDMVPVRNDNPNRELRPVASMPVDDTVPALCISNARSAFCSESDKWWER